jgi:hypothetical protein
VKKVKAVLIKDGKRTHQQVGTVMKGDGFCPYVIFADDLYVRWAQGDEHDNGRIPAYMRAEYYELG